jgi:hypothetical protein
MKRLTLLVILLLAAGLVTTQALAGPAVPSTASNLAAGLPFAVHVGWVTDYQPGTSITIQAHDGSFYTFSLTSDVKILPKDRAGELAVGSRVTIIAWRDPATKGWIAFGIVVHPAGSGAGSAPPTPTPTATFTPTPVTPIP